MRRRDIFALLVACAAGLPACDDAGEGPGGGGSGAEGTGAAGAGTAVSTAASTAASSAESQAASGGGAEPVRIGAACAADVDCGPGGRCILPTESHPVLAGGGPAGGYCTMDCDSDEDCPGEGSSCAKSGSKSACFLGCKLGPKLDKLNQALDPSKCLGREDLRCLDANGGIICVPSCGSDSQCEGGRVCDPFATVCVNSPTKGFPIGEKCAADEECAGVCVAFSPTESACGMSCVLGGAIDGNDCGGLAKGLCLFSPPKHGPGDTGYCTESCTKQDDCQNPTLWCESLEGVTGVLVPNGFCKFTKPCPNGDPDCVGNGLSSKCTGTVHGPFCLDPAFPLGAAGGG